MTSNYKGLGDECLANRFKISEKLVCVKFITRDKSDVSIGLKLTFMSDITLIKDVHLHFYSICYICFRTLKYVFFSFRPFSEKSRNVRGLMIWRLVLTCVYSCVKEAGVRWSGENSDWLRAMERALMMQINAFLVHICQNGVINITTIPQYKVKKAFYRLLNGLFAIAVRLFYWLP